MTNPKSYLKIKQKVSFTKNNLPKSELGQKKQWWHGEAKGIAKVTRENTREKNVKALIYCREVHYALTLTKKETGKICVDLINLSGEPLVADNCDVQIIIKMRERRLSTDWLPLEKNLVTIRKEIYHDLIWDWEFLNGKVQVKVIVTVVARHFNPTAQPENPFQIVRKILDAGIGSDFVIVSSSGTETKCHKSFLCAHSDVLRTMIEGSLTEAVTSRVEMVDMTDEAVKAFLAFLYYWDITEACTDCEIALELLHAAHKYDISSLESAMRDLFLKKESSWFTVDGAVKLFAFCRNLYNGQELKMRGVEVLKTYVDTLEKSECFKELFRKDPEAAMDLFKCCFAT